MKKLFMIACLLLLGLGLWVDNSLLVSSGRRIASTLDQDTDAKKVARLGDLSELQGPEFMKAFKYALIQNAHALEDENEISFTFGNFLMAGDEGQKVFVCNQYPYMELSFVADGVAFSGEAPRVTIRGLCETASENIFIEPLKIPYRDILALPVSQQEFTPKESETHRQRISIQLRNITEPWPRQWNLVRVKLYDDQNRSLSLDGYEIISILGQPLTMEWGD